MTSANITLSESLQYISEDEYVRIKIAFDTASELPMINEQDNLLRLITNYAPLPYSIAEYGCGKRASIIIKKLLELGVSPHSMSRGMIIERDLSPSSLKEKNHVKRLHALQVFNPMHKLLNFNDQILLDKISSLGWNINTEKETLSLRKFELHNYDKVGFNVARSHIFLIVHFWDPSSESITSRVLDPTIDPHSMFPLIKIRRKLHSLEGVLFSASLGSRFRLINTHLTKRQRTDLYKLTGHYDVSSYSEEEEMKIVSQLLLAPSGSIGDPTTWSYANNVNGVSYETPNNLEHSETQKYITLSEIGSRINKASLKLRRDRIHSQNPEATTRALLDELKELYQTSFLSAPAHSDFDLFHIIKQDADWSEEELSDLINLEVVLKAHQSKKFLAQHPHILNAMHSSLEDEQVLHGLQGYGRRLENRIYQLGNCSKDSEGRIDARNFTTNYNQAVVEVISQMNQAKLLVYIDKVGNIHGLLCSKKAKDTLTKDSSFLKQYCQNAICFASHIDTVLDAGKYDGRLGVLSGIEVLEIINELGSSGDLEELDSLLDAQPLLVSAFSNEEMTYTAPGISMPGSAAVSGQANVDEIYKMKNFNGESYLEGLQGLLEYLSQAQGKIHLEGLSDQNIQINDLPHPTLFFTPYLYERHIEQGPILDEANIPLILVPKVRGIYQEDFSINGSFAINAALRINSELNSFCKLKDQDDTRLRITVGCIETRDPSQLIVKEGYEIRLFGETNHAGTTRREDRYDAGLAAAELSKHIESLSLGIKVSHTILEPGLNRNVIPGKASLFIQTNISQNELEALLHPFFKSITEDSSKSYTVFDWKISALKQTPKASDKVRLTIDARFTDEEILHQLKGFLDELVSRVDSDFQCKTTRSVEQYLSEVNLSDTGQILHIERSYGGSHNPNEISLSKDIIRGTLAQLALTIDVLKKPLSNSEDLFTRAYKMFPVDWDGKKIEFSSGALHDVCNISKASSN